MARRASTNSGTVRTSGSTTPSSCSSATTCASRISWASGTGSSVRRRSVCTTPGTCSVTGPTAAYERLRLMQPEAAGAQWDHTQTWRNALAGRGPPDDVGGRPRDRVVGCRRRSVLRLGELHRSASPDGPTRAVVRSVRTRGRVGGAAGGASRRARHEAAVAQDPLARRPRQHAGMGEPRRREPHTARSSPR